MSTNKTAKEYIDSCAQAINSNPTMAQNDKEGWRYVCRNVGAGLDIWDIKEAGEAIKSFYSTAIVRCCVRAGKPVPVDNKQVVFWLLEARSEQVEKARAR